MEKKEEGPDQGRAWAVAVAGCVINSLLSGISRATGLFYVALIETYGVSRMEANLPFTVRNVVRNLSSPLVGAIGQRYGARDITFIGGIFGSLGIALCCFAPNVTWIAVLWGGIHGLGVALGNTLFAVMINLYFVKYRATAAGLSLSGACIGSFILPVVLEYMLSNVGLSGTFLISGGFLLHVLPAALLMNKPLWIERMERKQKTKKLGGAPSNAKNTSTPLKTIAEGIEAKHVDNVTIPPQNVSSDEVKTAEDRSSQQVNRSARVFSRSGVDNLAFVGSKQDIAGNVDEKTEVEYMQEIRLRTISVGESISLQLPDLRRGEIQETSLKKGVLKVIKDPMFHVISMSMAGFAMLFDPAITIIVDYITDKGLKEDDAKYFISMMSLGDLMGRLCFGWVTDRNYLSMPKFMLLLHVLQGICFLVLPWFSSFDMMLTIIMIYGLASGACLVMFPLLVAKYLVSVQSLAIGSINFFTGIISFAVPLLIGYFRDNAGSYDGMFMLTGSLSIAAGCLWLFEPFFVRLQKTQRSASCTVRS